MAILSGHMDTIRRLMALLVLPNQLPRIQRDLASTTAVLMNFDLQLLYFLVPAFGERFRLALALRFILRT
jgi:hypothetical protein